MRRAGLSAFTYLKSPVDPWSAGLAERPSPILFIRFSDEPGLTLRRQPTGCFRGSRMLGGSIGHDFFGTIKARTPNQVVGISINSLTSGGIIERTVWQPQGTGRVVNGTLTQLVQVLVSALANTLMRVYNSNTAKSNWVPTQLIRSPLTLVYYELDSRELNGGYSKLRTINVHSSNGNPTDHGKHGHHCILCSRTTAGIRYGYALYCT